MASLHSGGTVTKIVLCRLCSVVVDDIFSYGASALNLRMMEIFVFLLHIVLIYKMKLTARYPLGLF